MNKKKIIPAKTIRMANIDYRDIVTPKRFVSGRGKIRTRRATGLSVQGQRKITLAVKSARGVALLPHASTAR